MGPKRFLKALLGIRRRPSPATSKSRGAPRFEAVEPLSRSLQVNLQTIHRRLASDDLQVRTMKIGGSNGRAAALLYFEAMVDTADVDDHILKQLMSLDEQGARGLAPGELKERVLSARGVHEIAGVDEFVWHLMEGNAVLVLDECASALAIECSGVEHRSVGLPQTERAVRGARDAFIEVSETNISLIRRRLRDEKLRVTRVRLGRRTQNRTSILHIDGVADPDIVRQVREHLEQIDIDGILDSGAVEEFLTKPGGLLFPIVQATERPDRVVAGLLQGQVAVVIDYTPFVLLLPVTLPSLFNAPDDYNHRPIATTLMRFLRVIGWLAGLYSPAIYVALTMVNPEVIPLNLTLVVANSREGVPYPPFFEALVMTFAIEFLAEASTRLPTFIGPTATVVGGLIIGTSAAEAKIISNIMIIVTAVMALGTYTLPNFDLGLAWRVVRFAFVVGAAMFGIFGITLFSLVLLIYLASIKSFGVPYLSPVAPAIWKDMKDAPAFAWPWWAMRERPRTYRPVDSDRMNGSPGTKTSSKGAGDGEA